MISQSKNLLTSFRQNSPAPGGGSVAALSGSLSAALTAMVAALSHEKKGFLSKRDLMDEVGQKAQIIKDRLAFLIDEDTNAFNSVMTANRINATIPKEVAEKGENKYYQLINMLRKFLWKLPTYHLNCSI